jgi:hypothetical protein
MYGDASMRALQHTGSHLAWFAVSATMHDGLLGLAISTTPVASVPERNVAWSGLAVCALACKDANTPEFSSLQGPNFPCPYARAFVRPQTGSEGARGQTRAFVSG